MNISKRNLLNIALLLFTLVLIILVVYEPGKNVALTPPTLTKLDANDISYLKISRRASSLSEEDIEFKKTPDGWVMLKPYQLKANNFRIEAILKLLSAVSFSQNDLKKLDKSTFGLNTPQVTITFNNNTTIKFGHNKSLKNHRYVEIDSTLHMIADTFQYQLVAKTESYIDHKLLPERNTIIKLALPNLTLNKKDGIWISTPKQDSFSADSINQLIGEWKLSQAYDVNKIKFLSGTQRKANVTIHMADNSTLKFHIENTKDNFNLINIDSSIRYILSKDRRNKLLKLTDINQSD